MAGEGRASVEIVADVRGFARQAEKDLNEALAKIKLNAIDVPIDAESVRASGEKAGADLGGGLADGLDSQGGKVRASGEEAGRKAGEGAEKGAKESLKKGKFSKFLKDAFTPNPDLFRALRAPFAAAFSVPIVGAIISVAAIAAAAFIGAFAAAIATAGLGAVFLGIGAAALFGSRQARMEAEEDLAKAEERVRKAEQRAQSGTAAAKRSLAEARAELAKAQAVVENNAAFVKLDSSLTRLGETLKSVGKSAAAPLVGPFTEALNLLSDTAVRLEPVLSTIFTALAPAIVPLTAGIAGFVEEFLKVLTADPATLQALRDALIAVGANLPRLGVALGQLFVLLASNENNVRNIGLLFGLLEQVIFRLGVIVFGLSKALDGAIVAWNAVRAAGSATVEWITGTAVPAIGEAISAIVSFFASLPGRITVAIATMVAAVASTFIATGNAARSIAIATINAVAGYFAQLPGRIRNAISSLISIVSSIFSSASSTARAGASSLVSGTVSIIATLAGRISSALSGVRSAVTRAFAGASSWLVSAGRSIIDGVRRGIVAAISGAAAAAREASRRIVQAFRDSLRIGSPSQVAEDQVGRWIPAGIARGVKNNQYLVTDQISDTSADMMRGLTIPGGVRGGDGASIHITVESDAIRITGQGADAGRDAAEALLERLSQAVLVR